MRVDIVGKIRRECGQILVILQYVKQTQSDEKTYIAYIPIVDLSSGRVPAASLCRLSFAEGGNAHAESSGQFVDLVGILASQFLLGNITGISLDILNK